MVASRIHGVALASLDGFGYAPILLAFVETLRSSHIPNAINILYLITRMLLWLLSLDCVYVYVYHSCERLSGFNVHVLSNT